MKFVFLFLTLPTNSAFDINQFSLPQLRQTTAIYAKETSTTSKMTEWSGDDVQQAKDQHNMWPLDEYNIKLLNEVHPKSWANNANTNADDDGEYEGANNEMVFDFIAIGAGAGGLVSSRQAARRGAKSAMISFNLAGGDCLNVGCVPSKALIRCPA